MLTNAQLIILRDDILADPILAAYPNNSDGAFAVAAAYNIQLVPDFFVWKTRVSQEEIVGKQSPEATNWSWTAYINRSQGERDGWREMFADTGSINYSRANVRQGLSDIFSGAGGANQRTHLIAMGKRSATRAEKLFSTGTGSLAVPATMGFEGNLSYQDVQAARSV